MGFTLMALAMLMNMEVRGNESPLPDLTQGTEGIDRSLTYNLGATGMRGWIYTPYWPQNIAAIDRVQGRTTGSSRQILVTHVGEKSPADGVMQVDDVILGVDGQPFTDDARKSLAWAIQRSEKTPVAGESKKPGKTRSGYLALLRWRAGKTETVELKMRVLGTYSDTAPYDCPKSAKILKEACEALQKETDMWQEIRGLAMLATGDRRLMPQIKAIAQAVGPPTLKYDMPKIGMGVWQMAYQGIFLCEYHLLTRDRSVLPAIREITLTLAKGQSMYGTLGHGISDLTDKGAFHGSIAPYGPVNECGVAANLAIVLGKRCGVKDPVVDAAIARANGFFGYFVDKGSLPYGEHEPWDGSHANNGKNHMAAALFGVQDDHPREAQFWSKMCVAAYPSTEYGHTGQGFSYLWRMVGANMGGPEAAAAFFKELSWHFDLARRCDGTFTYDGSEQYGPGKTDDNTYYGKSSYYNVMSPNACHVLSYAVAYQTLHITGKDMKTMAARRGTKAAARLTQQEVAEAIAAGRFDLDRKKMNVEELSTALGKWSPIVRLWAAEELAKRPEAQAMIPHWITAAEGPDARLRLGACEALRQLKASQALPVFVRLLRHEDRGLRRLAASAIKDLGVAAQPALNDILKAFIDTAEPPVPVNFADPMQLAHGKLIEVLFSGNLDIKQADPELVFKAARAASKNADCRARGCMADFINQLTADEVRILLPDLVELATSHGPANTMFSREIRVGAFKVLAKYHFQEGIQAAPLVAKGKYGCHNAVEIMKTLETYGSAAKEIIPDLKQLIIDYRELRKDWVFPDSSFLAVENAIKVIEAAKDHPPLLSAGPQGPAATKLSQDADH